MLKRPEHRGALSALGGHLDARPGHACGYPSVGALSLLSAPVEMPAKPLTTFQGRASLENAVSQR